MRSYEKTKLRAGNGDFYTYDLLISNRRSWYQIIYQIPADTESPAITHVPQKMIPYLESFRPMP